MTDAMRIEPAKVKAYVDRVETLEKEKQAIGDDVRDVYDEAKKAGLNTKALRKVVAKRRAKTPDPQVEAAMHAYELALDEAASLVSNGETSLREATALTGFSKSAIQRQVSQRKRNAVSGTPHDADGVVTEMSPKAPDASSTVTARATEPRSPVFTSADSTEPAVPTGNEGRAGERGQEEARQEEVERSEGIEPVVIGLEDRSSAIELAPQPNVCSTDPKPMKREIGAVAKPAPVDETPESGERIGHNSKRACISPASTTWQEITLSRDAADAAQAAEVARIAAEKEAERERIRLEREAERTRNAAIDADPLEIPAHLDRRTKDRRQTAAPQ